MRFSLLLSVTLAEASRNEKLTKEISVRCCICQVKKKQLRGSSSATDDAFGKEEVE